MMSGLPVWESRRRRYLGIGLVQCCRFCLIFSYRYCIWHGQEKKKIPGWTRLGAWANGWTWGWAIGLPRRNLGSENQACTCIFSCRVAW